MRLGSLGSHRMGEECRQGKTAPEQEPEAGLVDRNLLCFQRVLTCPFFSLLPQSLPGSSVSVLGT